jgi:uncharacterized protein (UPF0276 family)
MRGSTLHGVGLGLRRELIPDLRRSMPRIIDFLELAPENWLEMGGSYARDLDAIARQRPLVAHGLSLNLGGFAPLDEAFLRRIKAFLDQYRIALFSEHLSWCADDGHLYDLLPIPFTEEAVAHVAARIRRTQELLQRRIAIENPSYYMTPDMAEMGEIEFILRVLQQADCDLHLDINNVYVNSRNHGYDARQFIDAMPPERLVYMHMAGHQVEDDGLLVDTHGAAVIDPVWSLLDYAYQRLGLAPTLLERDFNIPPLADLLPELGRIAQLQQNREVQRATG